MKWALLTIDIWCNEIGLSVNPDKTGFVAFTRKRKRLGLFEPQFIGVKLSLMGSVKYLGVILDSRLTWREYVDVKTRKAHNLLWACRVLLVFQVQVLICTGNSGLNPERALYRYICCL